MSDANLLEMAAKDFKDDRSQETFNKFMTVLENSNVVVPVLIPKDTEITPIMKAAIREGRPVPLSPANGAPLSPCLLKKNNEDLVMPLFSSISSIPADKKFPAIVSIPFSACVSMVLSSGGKVNEAVFDPFTDSVTLGEKLLKAVAEHQRAAAEGTDHSQTKTVTMNAQQFGIFAHIRVAGELLPKMLFAAPHEALKKLRKEKSSIMLELYTSVYPKENPCPYSEDDFTVMTLNIAEGIQITRIDLPEKDIAVGIPVRIYVTWKNESEMGYYLIEKGEETDNIAQITEDGHHNVLRPVQNNSTEIEDVLNAADGSTETEDASDTVNGDTQTEDAPDTVNGDTQTGDVSDAVNGDTQTGDASDNLK